MKNTKSKSRSDFSWFMRSFILSSTIVFAVLTIVFGLAYLDAASKKNTDGTDYEIVRYDDSGFYFFNRRIF